MSRWAIWCGERTGRPLFLRRLFFDSGGDGGEGPTAREEKHVVQTDEEGVLFPVFCGLEHPDPRVADFFHPVLLADWVHVDQFEPDGGSFPDAGLFLPCLET